MKLANSWQFMKLYNSENVADIPDFFSSLPSNCSNMRNFQDIKLAKVEELRQGAVLSMRSNDAYTSMMETGPDFSKDSATSIWYNCVVALTKHAMFVNLEVLIFTSNSHKSPHFVIEIDAASLFTGLFVQISQLKHLSLDKQSNIAALVALRTVPTNSFTGVLCPLPPAALVIHH